MTDTDHRVTRGDWDEDIVECPNCLGETGFLAESEYDGVTFWEDCLRCGAEGSIARCAS